MPIAPALSAALPYIATAASVGSSIYGASQARVAANKQADIQKSALAQQQELVKNLKYTPIDLEKLKADVHNQAVTNATQSLALERQLHPELAQTRDTLNKQISTQLALGGKLSPDIANQVARAARTSGSLSGAPAGPLTAALIGSSAMNLQQQRQQNAANLLQANPLLQAGLDPGALASQEVAQNAAMNKFNMEKAGINSNLINSEANVNAGIVGKNAGIDANTLNMATSGLNKILGMIPSGGANTIGFNSDIVSNPSQVSSGMFNYKMPDVNTSLNNYVVPSGGVGSPLSGAVPFKMP